MKNNKKDTPSSSTELMTELHALVVEGEKLIREASGNALGEGAESLRNRLDNANTRLQKLYSETKTQVADGAKRVNTTIRANPYQSLAIAAGVGLLVGFLSRRSAA